MLSILRNKKTAKKIWIGLAIIIIFSFIFWGSAATINKKDKGEKPFAGKIFGKPISMEEFHDSIFMVKATYRMQLGETFNQLSDYLNYNQLAWDRLLELKEAKRMSIKATDKEVIDEITSSPVFNHGGRFNKQLYYQMLNKILHVQPRKFEEFIRQNIILNKLFEKISLGINLTEKEVENEYRKANEQMSLNYITALIDNFKKNISLSDEQIRNYFNENQLHYKQPLSYNLEIISSNSKDKIESLLPHLGKPEYLEKLAKDSGLNKTETGLFAENASIPHVGWSPEISNLLAQAKPGQYIGPAQIDRTFYLFKMIEKKEPYIPEFEKIKNQVKNNLLIQKATEQARNEIEKSLKKVTELYNKNPAAVNFEAIAKTIGLKAGSTDLFKFGSYIEGVGASDTFWNEAEKLKSKEISPVIQIPNGFYIIRIKDFVPIDENKFKQESTAFKQKMLQQKKEEALASYIEDLRKKGVRY